MRKILRATKDFTMTSPARVVALVDAVRYLTVNGIPGDIVECGVWRGGSMMAAAMALSDRNEKNRTLWLYDTFEGMTAPSAQDLSHDGRRAEELLQRDAPGAGLWCKASLDEVHANLVRTNYDMTRVRFIVGPVETTIPVNAPERIGLLRLDTDWYESTKHELTHLYPLLVEGGILIVDDYGHWQGARKAVDEYFARQAVKPLLQRIDYTGRLIVVPRRIGG